MAEVAGIASVPFSIVRLDRNPSAVAGVKGRVLRTHLCVSSIIRSL